MPVSTYRNPVNTPESFQPQHQNDQPGSTAQMNPRPICDNEYYKSANKLDGLAALITGGDSGIGQAVAIAFAKEGANVAIAYLDEGLDAKDTISMVESYGRKCYAYRCDLKSENSANELAAKAHSDLGRLDILVNNIAVQYPQNSIEDITGQQLTDTFSTNVLSYFHMIRACLTYLMPGASIINTSSVSAYKGNETLIDYSATKGAIVSLTRSLSLSLAASGIRVNSVAPGPVWTPLIPSSFDENHVAQFGKNVPLGRAAQPFEIAPAYVFLASEDSAYMTGQVLHVNGGTITES